MLKTGHQKLDCHQKPNKKKLYCLLENNIGYYRGNLLVHLNQYHNKLLIDQAR